MSHPIYLVFVILVPIAAFVFFMFVGLGQKIIEAIHGLIAAIHVQTVKLTTPQHGLILAPDELAILSKLLRGYIVGPTARAVLEKVHMFGRQERDSVRPN